VEWKPCSDAGVTTGHIKHSVNAEKATVIIDEMTAISHYRQYYSQAYVCVAVRLLFSNRGYMRNKIILK